MNLAIGSMVISSAVDPTPIGTFKENVTLVFSYEKASSFFSSSSFFLNYYPLRIQLLKNIMFFTLFLCLCSTLCVCVCVCVGGGGGGGRGV